MTYGATQNVCRAAGRERMTMRMALLGYLESCATAVPARLPKAAGRSPLAPLATVQVEGSRAVKAGILSPHDVLQTVYEMALCLVLVQPA
jgi:uncharacterized protein (DUF885 family)